MEIENVDEIARSIADKIITGFGWVFFFGVIVVFPLDFVHNPPGRINALRDLAGWTVDSRSYLQPIVIEGKLFRVNSRSGDMCELREPSASSPDKTPSAELEKLLRKYGLEKPTNKPENPPAKPEPCFLADKKAQEIEQKFTWRNWLTNRNQQTGPSH